MIRLQNLTKIYTLDGRSKRIADNITATFPTGVSVGLLGRNGAGKSSLLRMISGAMLPTSGQILSTGTISWPVGFAGSFHAELTGEQNTRFIARVYGVDSTEMRDFVEDFAELGAHFYLPLRTYSSGMKSRLAFGVSMAVPFDTYLVDEVSAVGDASFKAKSNRVFNARMANAGAVVVSHSMSMLRKTCEAGAVLENGKLSYFHDINDAIEVHSENMARAKVQDRKAL
ncbi:ABC transporter ATP-binding protein [Paracoccus seriniphilus]|uniref:Capsular polysaccharide transport system ATP-binding protein n=1 Tax=Paracoccus seriniphilus TaxID=184748 RepID=A0A239PNG1_9RHOB|nr:ABC transporter ATP-binding protein [Paracoccus seriniphilus]WCR14745.1 ABC transporter ATP-binding protein [Paracoccus seriniphilus]SNT71851.1 capsular polysaccharide transport system ATP-binding protein [Paracoccus seriniphilus]